MSDSEEIVYGRQTVKEALLSGKAKKLYLLKGQKGTQVGEIKNLAQKNKIVCRELDSEGFSAIVQGKSLTGGVAASVNSFIYCDIDEILQDAKSRDEYSLVLVLDHIEDPHNLGALLRTAEASGAMGVIIPAKRSVGVTPAVRKVASGAAEWIPVSRVTNIAQTIDYLKENGYWVYGADISGTVQYSSADWKRSVALVLGSEGKGLSALTKKKCDLLVNIPMNGKLNSLNVSVAGGILMFEHLRQKA